MATVSRVTKQAETDIAVLQVQVKNIENDVAEIKLNLKEMRDDVSDNNDSMRSMLKEISTASATAHAELHEKVSALEKWRWMMMGAGIVLGSMGFDMLANLVQ